MAQLAIDCGNNFIQIVGVLDSEKGKVVPLMDTNHPEGFLSYIAWNGEKFVTGPELFNSPKLRSVSEGLLKNRLAEQITLNRPGGKEHIQISGREALQFVIKEAVLRANKILWEVYREKCTGVTLAYPASWLSNQRLNLIRTLDGMPVTDDLKINVTGTISEPAAGGLSYVQHLKEKNPFNVLVIDVGAGTTDVSIVHVIPEGQKNKDGKIYYYDIIATGGLSDVAGSNFTRTMADLLRKRISEEGPNVPKYPDFLIMEQAEKCKIASEGTERDLPGQPQLFCFRQHPGQREGAAFFRQGEQATEVREPFRPGKKGNTSLLFFSHEAPAPGNGQISGHRLFAFPSGLSGSRFVRARRISFASRSPQTVFPSRISPDVTSATASSSGMRMARRISSGSGCVSPSCRSSAR